MKEMTHRYNKIAAIIAVAMMVLSVGCGRVSGRENERGDDTLAFESVYCGRYVRIGCPEGYVVVNNQLDDPLDVVMIGTDSLDSLLALPPLSLELKPQGDNRSLRYPEVSVVLSRQRISAPLRFFAEMSAKAHSEDIDPNYEFLGITDVDSLTVDGLGALEQHFGYRNLVTGDTVNMQQIVVQKEDNTLFYITARYNLSADSAKSISESVIRSISIIR